MSQSKDSKECHHLQLSTKANIVDSSKAQHFKIICYYSRVSKKRSQKSPPKLSMVGERRKNI